MRETGNRRRAVVVREHLRRVAEAVVRLAEDGIKAAVDVLINRHRVAVGREKIAERIEAQTEDIRLPVAILLDAHPVRPEAKRAAAHPELPAVAAFHGRLVRHALTSIHPAIEPTAEIVGHVMRVICGERPQHYVALVGLSVAVGVLQSHNVRDRKNDSPVFVRRDCIRHGESVGENFVLPRAPVGIEIGQDADEIARRFVRRSLDGVGVRLRHPQATHRIEAHRNRLPDFRLRRHQLHGKPFRHDKGFQFIRRAEPRSRTHHFIEDIRRLRDAGGD